jgi:hypothetical protein
MSFVEYFEKLEFLQTAVTELTVPGEIEIIIMTTTTTTATTTTTT